MKHILNGTGVEIQDFVYREDDHTTLIQAVVQLQVTDMVTDEDTAYNHLATYLGVDSKTEKLNANLAYVLEAQDFAGATLYRHIARDYETLATSLVRLRDDLEKSPNDWYVLYQVDEEGEKVDIDHTLSYAPIVDGEPNVGASITLAIEELNLLTTPLNMKAKYEPRIS